MRLLQFQSPDGRRQVGRIGDDGSTITVVHGAESVRELALLAARESTGLAAIVNARLGDEVAEYDTILRERRVLPPLDHPDPAHCYVTGTGLTHLGSAKARDSMHSKGDGEEAGSPGAPSEPKEKPPQTDSMRLFQWGVEGGKAAQGPISVQPEWFYKGDGSGVVPPEQPLTVPGFALDGGEEAELVGLYVISDEGEVLRAGFALGNEFSDHVMERQNYLYLAHSKIRPCSFGPELLVGELPADIRGSVRILRDGGELWSAPFLTGETNMSYYVRQLEHHQFKYDLFRRAGDVHCHFFGTATLSFSAGVEAQEGDVFEISAAEFGRPLRNPLHVEPQAAVPVLPRAL